MINHAPNSHDDVANAAAGAVVLATFAKQPMVISNAMLARASMRGGGVGYYPSGASMMPPTFQGSFSDMYGGPRH